MFFILSAARVRMTSSAFLSHAKAVCLPSQNISPSPRRTARNGEPCPSILVKNMALEYLPNLSAHTLPTTSFVFLKDSVFSRQMELATEQSQNHRVELESTTHQKGLQNIAMSLCQQTGTLDRQRHRNVGKTMELSHSLI